MDDVRPLPLTDDDDFFSDIGSDEPYSRHSEFGAGSRLVIDSDRVDSTRPSTVNSGDITKRSNPFTPNSARGRGRGDHHHHTNQNVRVRNFDVQQNRNTTEADNQYDAISNHNHNAYSNKPERSEFSEPVRSSANRYIPSSGERNDHGAQQHCHIPHKHEEDNTVRNQLIAISIFTTLFGIGETVGEHFISYHRPSPVLL